MSQNGKLAVSLGGASLVMAATVLLFQHLTKAGQRSFTIAAFVFSPAGFAILFGTGKVPLILKVVVPLMFSMAAIKMFLLN